MDTTSIDSDDEKKFPIPKRYVVTFLLLIATTVCFANRHTVPSTLVAFVAKKQKSKGNSSVGYCKKLLREENQNHLNPAFVVEIEESTLKEMNLFFYLGYISTQLVGGIGSDLYGAKYLINFCLVGTSLINLVTPPLIEWTKGSPTFLKIARMLVGMVQGPYMPSIINLIAHWIPPRERAFLTAITISGVYLASILTHFCISFIRSSGNWATPLYVYGSLGLVTSLFWHFFIFSNPDKDPHITNEEKMYLELEMNGIIDHKKKTIPFRAILTSLDVWALIFASMGHKWVWYIMVQLLPVYFRDLLNISQQVTDYMHLITLVLMIGTVVIFGFFSDWAFRNEYIALLTLRKSFSNLGMMGPPIYMLSGSFAACHEIPVHVLFMISLILMGFIYLGIFLIPMDLSPNYAGCITALINAAGITSAMVVNKLGGLIAPDKTLFQYRTFFWITLAVSTASNLLYMIFGSTKLQSWNQQKRRTKAI